MVITYPLVKLSEYITKIFDRGPEQATVSREEVSAMVNVGVEEGVFQAKEKKIIQNFIKLDSVLAEDIMTPNLVVESVPETMTMKEFYALKELSHSRIPVYKENRDYITGYILRATVLERLAEDKFDIKLSQIMRPMLSFGEEDSVSVIWEKMLESKEHISVITDEYGCMRGLVTMEDVIETMLGVEIVDEYDKTEDMQELARERWQKMRQQRVAKK